MAKYYAHSNFATDVDDYGITRKSIAPGDEITQKDLGISKDEWEGLIDLGVVSEDPYPDIPDHISPAEHAIHMENADAIEAEATELRLTAGQYEPASPAQGNEMPAPGGSEEPAKSASGTQTNS